MIKKLRLLLCVLLVGMLIAPMSARPADSRVLFDANGVGKLRPLTFSSGGGLPVDIFIFAG